MRILITGGAGYIGDAAVKTLLERGHVVTILDNLMYGGAYMRKHKNLRFIRADIRNKQVVYDQIIMHDSVLHLAAIVGDGACAVNPDVTADVNFKATKYIADLCRQLNKTLVFASTCSVYGSNPEFLTEDSETSPLSIYAGTKLEAETFVRLVPKHYIFRLGTLFGLGGEHSRLRCDLVANILTFKACAGEKLTVFGGEQWRPLLHVRDAGAIMATATVKCPEKYGTYILAKKNIQMVDLARSILRSCGLNESRYLDITDMPFEDQRNYKINMNEHGGRQFIKKYDLKDGVVEMRDIIGEGRIKNPWATQYHNAKFAKGFYD